MGRSSEGRCMSLQRCLCFSLLLERPKMFCVTQYREQKRKEQGEGGGGGGGAVSI